MGLELQAIATLLALINPAMCTAIFLRVEGARPRPVLVAHATRAALAVGVILVVAALAGARVLHLFGVSLDAFSVAGGGVLAWIGFSMLRGGSPPGAAPAGEPSDSPAALSPLILFAASPGTITGVITLSVTHSRLEIPTTALVAIAVATASMWLAILLGIRLNRGVGGSGFARDTATRFMGLIVIAMGVQFALTGMRAFMAA